MDELTRRRLIQLNHDAAQLRVGRERILEAMLDAFFAQNNKSQHDQPLLKPLISPTRPRASHASPFQANHAISVPSKARESENQQALLSSLVQEIQPIYSLVCATSDSSRPFCLCKYKKVWLPREVKSYQVKDRSERYFSCFSTTYDLRKYYEYRFCVLGLSIFRLNVFIDDKGHMFGVVERSGAQNVNWLEFKFNMIIRNSDTNEFISHEGLALPATDKSFHFAFRVDRTLFDSYFLERKLIRGKSFSCSLIVERSYVPNSSKKYFKH